MTKTEIKSHIDAWLAIQIELDIYMDNLREMLGASPDSPMFHQIYKMQEAHTAAVAQLIGDTETWLYWWFYECRRGTVPGRAYVGDKRILIKTTKQLAAIIHGIQA